MMPNSTTHAQHAAPSLRSLVICIFACLLISACGGGISGTGDGGPTTIIEMGTTDVVGMNPVTEADSGSTGSADTSTDGNAQEETGAPMPTDTEQRTPTPNVSQLIPESLRLLASMDDNTSRAQPLAAQLNMLQQEVIQALQTINTTQGTPEDVISNAFDTTLRYSLNGSETVTAASTTSAISYLFSTNDERVIQVLQQDDTLTVRHLNRSSNSLLQALVISEPNGTTVIEADLNQNGLQSYIRTFSTASITTVFEQHPTDPSIARHRELIDASGELLTVQSCAASQDCTLDGKWSNSDSTTNTQFSTNLTTIDNSLAAIASPTTALAAEANEAVLSQVTIESPTEEKIQCGLQRVTDSIRAFCLLPQPLGPTSLFSETLAGSEIFYQLLE